MGILDFELFNAGDMLNKAVKNPEQMLLGAADPFGAKVWSGITGKDYKPIVNQFGGATDDAYKAAEAKGINTGAARGMHQVAQTVAGMYGGAALGGLGGLGGTAGNAGNAAQGLSMGGSGLGLSSGGGTGLASMGGGTGLSGAGAQIGYSGAASSGGGLLSAGNMKTVSDMAGLASKAGVFDSPQGPAAQSAGIPGRQADFTGLLSAGRGGQPTGAEKLMAQRAARRG